MHQTESEVQESKKRRIRQEIKKAALLAAVDIALKRMNRSPKRCARNITELGINAFPNRFSMEEYPLVQKEFLLICKAKDPIKAKELFVSYFINDKLNKGS
jgi:hypothetical protein